jgi:hypothetical protein
MLQSPFVCGFQEPEKRSCLGFDAAFSLHLSKTWLILQARKGKGTPVFSDSA